MGRVKLLLLLILNLQTCCVAACFVLFVVLREEFADSRAGFRCHPSNMLQKTLLPFHWRCQDEVGPAPSGGMFTWRACCCLCRNKPSLMPCRLLLSKEKNKKQHEWLCSVFCPLKAVICVSVSVRNACVPLISPEWEQNTKLHFFLAHIRRLMIKFGDKSWFVLCFRLFIAHAHTCSQLKFTPSCQVGFPMCFSGRVFNSHRSFSHPKVKFLFRVVNLRGANHLLFFLFFSACALKSHVPTAAITETFHATQRPLFSAMFGFCSFHPRFQNEIIKWFCCEESAQRAAANISRSHPASALSCQDSIHHSAAKIKFAGNLLYWSVSEISTYTVTVELYWMCVVQDVRSPVLGTIDLRSSFFFCWSFF